MYIHVICLLFLIFLYSGTKTDLRTDSATIEALAEAGQVVVEQEAGKDLASKVGAVDYVECSALTQEGIEEVFNKVGDRQIFTFFIFIISDYFFHRIRGGRVETFPTKRFVFNFMNRIRFRYKSK